MNICFEYLYWQGANYKNWGQVVFSAEDEDLSISKIRSEMRSSMVNTLLRSSQTCQLSTSQVMT